MTTAFREIPYRLYDRYRRRTVPGDEPRRLGAGAFATANAADVYQGGVCAMPKLSQVSSLIGDIYDAALDASLWPGTLEKTCKFVGGQVAGLLAKNSVSKIGSAYYHFGADPDYLQLYEQTYSRFDPLAPLIFFPVGEVTTIRDYMTDEDLHNGRFYREWLQPQGWIDGASVVLDKSATSCAILSVVRKEANGLVDDEMLQRMRLIVPHMRRAVLIGNVIDLKAVEATSMADALDGLSAGMFLVDARGRIVHANVRGHAMLAERSPLHATRGMLATSDPDAGRALRDVFIAAGSGDAAVGAKGIAVPLSSNGKDHVAHVLPLTSGARRRAGTAYAAVAVVFVHKAVLEIPSPPEMIARAFKLTPSELRVLLAIVEIGGVPETAEALGVGKETVRSHLKEVFAKTGTNSQVDLVKLIAAFPSVPDQKKMR
jgi:DNA-binding CsgD family transcriptional regulator/PAS domain-containing protein